MGSDLLRQAVRSLSEEQQHRHSLASTVLGADGFREEDYEDNDDVDAEVMGEAHVCKHWEQAVYVNVHKQFDTSTQTAGVDIE